MDSNPSWQSTVIGSAFVGLVALMFWRAMDDFNHFSVIWAGIGSIVGAELYAAHMVPKDSQVVLDTLMRMRPR